MGRVGIMGYIWDIGQCRDKKTVLTKTVLPNDVPFQRTVFEKTVLRRLEILSSMWHHMLLHKVAYDIVCVCSSA